MDGPAMAARRFTVADMPPPNTAGPAPTPAADQADPFRPSPLHQPAHPAAAAPPEAKPQGGLAAELRARDAMEQALRAEVHRLKEENAALRKGSDRAGRLESELQFLKAASVMQAGDPKAPLRLRQLEVDNARLRQENTRLNDRLRALESDEHRQRVLDHHSFMLRSTAARLDTDAASPASQQAAQAPVATDGERSVLVVRGQAPSAASRFQIQVHERAAAAEKAALTAKLRETEAKLEAASAELEKVQQWVTSVVAAHQQYPTLASTVPTTQLASPSARGWAPEGSMPSALQAQRSRLPTVL